MPTIHHGDCIQVMNAMPAESVDAIVTDPPYGLGFMGRKWDSLPPSLEWAEACLRVLKPGGHIVAFGGTRTWHRLAVAIEDAGFEMRDSLAWLYGSGFPKSHDVSKGIDKAADYRLQAAVRRAAVVAVEKAGLTLPGNSRHDWTVGEHAPGDKWWAEFQQWLPELTDEDRERVEGEIVATIRKSAGWFTQGDIYDVTAPATPEAEQWDGWGTALKPAFEPIVLARKPFPGTVAANVLEHGTGAINVDACRIGTTGGGTHCGNRDEAGKCKGHANAGRSTSGETFHGAETVAPSGRWPANVVLDQHAAAWVDEQSGVLKTGGGDRRSSSREVYGRGFSGDETERVFHANSGGASRFFYTAKAPKRERPNVNGVQHPTVKPLAIMQWLIRLVTPPGGTVLDPFAGSGTTIEAALIEGFDPVGIEMEADYLPLIQHRIDRQAGTLTA